MTVAGVPAIVPVAAKAAAIPAIAAAITAAIAAIAVAAHGHRTAGQKQQCRRQVEKLLAQHLSLLLILGSRRGNSGFDSRGFIINPGGVGDTGYFPIPYTPLHPLVLSGGLPD
jgi:hypothetical protein